MPQKTTRPILQPGFWDAITGLPAGVLIFMATVLVSTLFSIRRSLPLYAPLLILMAMALVTGLLAGITRLRRGPATGLMAGIVAAAILGYLWLAARPGEDFNPLVIGPIGMIVALGLSPLGGWLGARLRKAL
jgi:4-amino-4-deoxy-L-arabinose transferase-like glycosyltransferase